MDNLSENNTIGRYRIAALLGEGGMGAVYKAFDLSLERDVAVKVMHPQFARLPEFQERFLREARTAARLDHPGIVHVFDFGQQDGQLYIVMEFLPGTNLGQMMSSLRKKSQWIMLAEGMELLRQLALALDYAHNQGVLHRDIKPENIMFKPVPVENLPYRPVVTDLGLAKLAQGQSITSVGVSMGTPAYMSPEQALGKDSDARSDVYSLGILLYELATSRLPFPARTMPEAIRYQTKEAPPAPRLVRPDLPAALETVILKAIEKEPQARFQSAKELAQALITALPGATQVSEEQPATLGTVVSLVTQLQETPPAPRGDSLVARFIQEFGAAPDAGPDMLQVMAENTTSYSINMTKPRLVIGRDEACEVQLRGTKVSRQHTRLALEDGIYRVTDLNSTNGTYLDNTRLLPGVAVDWNPGSLLRIGDYWLRLVRPGTGPQKQAVEPQRHTASAEKPAAEKIPVTAQTVNPKTEVDVWPPPAPAGIPQPANPAQPGEPAWPVPQPKKNETVPDLRPMGQGRPPAAPAAVSLIIEKPVLVVSPGGAVTTAVTVINQSDLIDHFTVKVEGLPPGWVSFDQTTIQLFPASEGRFMLTLQPPREPGSRADQYRFTIAVSGQVNPTQVFRARASLSVTPFTQYGSEMYPEIVRSGKSTRVKVSNQGNQPETFTVGARDPGEELRFNPPQFNLTVPEGQTGVAEFRPEPRAGHWFGGERSYAFTAQVAAADGTTRQHNGEFISRARLSVLALLGLVSVCLLLTVGGILAAVFRPDPSPALVQQQQPVVFQPTDSVPVVVPPEVTNESESGVAPTALPPEETATPAPAAPPAPAAVDFSGVWYTNFAGINNLVQTGNHVEGTYTWYGDNPPISIQGDVQGNELIGTFGTEGLPFRFTLRGDSSSFDGTWTGNDGNSYQWCGVRSGGLWDGCGFSGHWNTISDYSVDSQPTADLVQSGGIVSGSFFNGLVDGNGTIENGVLGAKGPMTHYTAVGIYTVGGNTSTFEWTITFNSDQFVGFWIDAGGNTRKWCGWRDGQTRPDDCP